MKESRKTKLKKNDWNRTNDLLVPCNVYYSIHLVVDQAAMLHQTFQEVVGDLIEKLK